MGLTTTARFRRHHPLLARKWPLVGMLLVLTLFGHDAMMTAEAKAESLPSLGNVALPTLDHRNDTAPDLSAPHHFRTQHQSHPDVDCGVNANVAALQSNSFSAQLLPTALAESASLMSIGLRDDSSSERTTSPSVRRALLQVYRI